MFRELKIAKEFNCYAKSLAQTESDCVLKFCFIFLMNSISWVKQLRWLDRLKNDIHQKYDVFRNIISKALEHLQKAFWNDFAEFTSSWVQNSRKVHGVIIIKWPKMDINKYKQYLVGRLLRHMQLYNCNHVWKVLSESLSQAHSFSL